MGSRAKRALVGGIWLGLVLIVFGGALPAWAGLNETIKILKEAQAPATITAQEMEYLNDGNTLVAKGDVVIKQEDVWITAQKITISMLTGDFEAEGNVVWVDPEGRFEGDLAKFNQKTGLGYIVRGKGFLGPDQYVQGDFIQRVTTKELRIKNGVFSGCENCEGRRDWEVRSENMYVYIDEEAEATNLTLWIKETLPIFYFPYLSTPATKRKSGFLLPVLGLDSRRGIYALNAYFWNISDSQDMTFYLLNITARGVGGSLEYRYIWGKGHEGNFTTHLFYQYDKPVETRWFVKGKHTSEFSERTSLKADVDYISNREFERKFAEDVIDRSKRYAFSQAFLTHNEDRVQGLAVAKWVEDLAQVERNIPQRLPEVRLTATPVNLVNLGPASAYFDLFANIVHFHRVVGFEVERLNLRPAFFIALNLGPYLTVTPRATLRETLYNRNSFGEVGAFNRLSWEGRITAQSRQAVSFGVKSYQFRLVLEPKVEYQYIPDKDRRFYPHIDYDDFEYQQNRIIYSMGLRLYMRNGQELSENIELAGFSVSNNYRLIGPSQDRFGLVNFRFTANYPGALRWSVQAIYNPRNQQVLRANADIRLTISKYWDANLSSAFNKNIDSLFFSGGLTIKPVPELRIRLLARYDARNNFFQERRISVTYEACCWSVTLGYVRDRNLDGKEQDSLRFSFDLKNITGAAFK